MVLGLMGRPVVTLQRLVRNFGSPGIAGKKDITYIEVGNESFMNTKVLCPFQHHNRLHSFFAQFKSAHFHFHSNGQFKCNLPTAKKLSLIKHTNLY